MQMKSAAWLSIATTITTAAAACTRPLLEEATSRYVAAQSAGEPRYLQQLAPNLAAMLYTENGNATMPLHASILAEPLRIDHARAQHDLEACRGYVELIVTDDAHPYQLATQIYVDAAAGTINSIETLVTDAQDWLFSARHALHYVLQEDWTPIVPAERDEREVLRAAADAYLDLFSNSSVVVPWHDECRRLEGGLYTQPGSTCATGVPEGIEMVNRQYVIDEEYGTVGVFLRFGPSGLHDSHEFRIEGGRIKYIHTVTVCPTPNCGFGDPPAILQKDPGW
ncbi:hypothetical protein MCOR27_007329 [Pyricularia oryzae]|uniref:DUF8021 domain-containing protein n=4 Tax=Pyricularia TaxID=48558 RepID=A0ABQ8NRD3_PYRGI|nr:uncharacterized protein MGG_03457 [Pyricularia oryzae 70-15]ELQ40316.1 hypothetical protein OOU_Y34scaffold00448g16 [Pyricularia oryzae Y34]KAH8844101.1 hypothetical protein MCOR01_004879 [Pyricularia oryzae]KAI6301018.1 hypothetical protein MCOR33_003364 [Pyricularia grisea]EHA50151.1 hypothetical protein MGG_03457 [Pyricularia oryzae 70-15]KAH9431622.1 hypothetical protein MCOR02_008912 [Pyricularia oryzae]